MINEQRIAFLLGFCLFLGGCQSASTLPPSTKPIEDPKTGLDSYWYGKPGLASVANTDYDKLWNASAAVARDDLFDLDRLDYRDGVLTTKPMVSKQFFELWRNDSGTAREVVQNSLQTIRRTVRFRFEKTASGYTVTPKVLVERFSQPTKRVTSEAQYRDTFTYVSATPGVRASVTENIDEYWYPIARDTEMESQLADAIKAQLK